jgi:hypothetical protein
MRNACGVACAKGFRRIPSLVPGIVRRRDAGMLDVVMLDIVMLALGLGFFALSVGYTIACDRL